jgi:hypothetical protein
VAKKSRTPAPPRPVQAPKKRTEPRKPGRTRLWLAIATGALVLAGAAAALAFTFARGGGDAEAGGACEIQTVEAQGQRHVTRLPRDFEPNSYPRTSGPHHSAPLVYDEYPEPVPQLNLVHNLEHGAVAIQYGPDVPDATVAEVVAWYRNDPRGLIVAPLPEDEEAEDLSDKIAMTAWVAEREDEDNPQSRITKQEGKLAICSTFDEDAFNDFLDDYRAHGPEGFALDQLAPGAQ